MHNVTSIDHHKTGNHEIPETGECCNKTAYKALSFIIPFVMVTAYYALTSWLDDPRLSIAPLLGGLPCALLHGAFAGVSAYLLYSMIKGIKRRIREKK